MTQLSILISEGASTSAREAITVLGLAGRHVEVVDPNRHCLGRFSRFVRRLHRCPPLGADPEGYRDFIIDLVSGGRFDVLVPIHEQGYLLAAIAERLAPHVAVALPSFASYEQAISRIGFHKLLLELDIPQPRTVIATSGRELRDLRDFPFFLKTEIGTASRAVWMVKDAGDLARAADEIESAGAFGRGVLAQEVAEGPVEHAQAVFRQGRLVTMHGYRQLLRGAGGGPALKESVERPEVRGHLAQIGESLGWHGALSVDYILSEERGLPAYIDCNPRLVEPMSGWLAGVDLMDALLRVSIGMEPPEQAFGRPGVRSHLAMQVLMGLGLRGARRREILLEGWRAVTARGPYAGSREELTPVRIDWLGAVPLLATATALAFSPGYAPAMASRGWGAQLLTLETMRRIRGWRSGRS